MRIRELLEARPAYVDPTKTGSSRPYSNDIEDDLKKSWALTNGELPPEFAQIQDSSGLYDTSKVTVDWIKRVADAHPTDPKYRWIATSPRSVSGWLTGQDQKNQRNQEESLTIAIDRLKFNLDRYNKLWNPGGHYYNNRPYTQGKVPGYRGDARTKQVEPLAHDYDPVDIKYYLSAYKWARDKGLMPTIPPEQWVMLLLVEGTEEFGTRGELKTNLSPNMQKFQDKLEKMGMTNIGQLSFCTTVMDKITTAKRLNIPFYQAWNGSKIYMDRWNMQAQAVKDPKNKPLLDLVTSVLK
jgi:hypothetical protein